MEYLRAPELRSPQRLFLDGIAVGIAIGMGISLAVLAAGYWAIALLGHAT